MLKALVVAIGLGAALGAAPTAAVADDTDVPRSGPAVSPGFDPADGTTPGAPPTDQKTRFPDGPPVVVGGGRPTVHQG